MLTRRTVDDRPVDYERPPVVEISCGVTFKPIDGLRTPHLGALWWAFVDDFPKTSEMPPVVRISESGAQAGQLRIDFADLPRVWLVSEDERRHVQIQKDRFVYSWRRLPDEQEYPHFIATYQGFREALGRLREMLTAEMGLGDIEPARFELAYLNRIQLDPPPNGPGELGAVFPDFGWRSMPDRYLPGPEEAGLSLAFGMEGCGRLTVTARARKTREGVPYISAECSARSADATWVRMDDWFAAGHDWIVRGFTDLTSPAAHHAWRRTR